MFTEKLKKLIAEGSAINVPINNSLLLLNRLNQHIQKIR